MIEMNEDFQREFGAAMAQLRAVHQGLVGSAENARGEARAIAAAEDSDPAIVAYETSHAYWAAAERLRPVLGSFEDADRIAAGLMEAPEPEGSPYATRTERAYHERVKYLEGQLERLDTALRGRPATLDEKIRETETTEDLIDAVLRMVADTQWKSRYEQEKMRADTLAETTTGAARLLGVTTLPDILTAIERLVTGAPFDFENLPVGSLIAGQYCGSSVPGRRFYVGRFVEVNAGGGIRVDRICTLCDAHADAHAVSTVLSPESVRLPTPDEIIEFSKLSRAHDLLKLEGDE